MPGIEINNHGYLQKQYERYAEKELLMLTSFLHKYSYFFQLTPLYGALYFYFKANIWYYEWS